MLAKVAHQQSSWMRSLTKVRQLSRPLQIHAPVLSREVKDEVGWTETRNTLQATASNESQSLIFQQTSNSVDKKIRVMDQLRGRNREDEQVKLQADADAGEFLSVIATSKSPPRKDLDRARISLMQLERDLADPRAAIPGESGFQKARRQLKALTGKLDRMLYDLRQQQDFAQVEAVAFMWEEVFPQFAGQRKHWSVICEHYALALNSQQKFHEVVDKFSGCYQKTEDSRPTDTEISLLTPRLAQSILVALGHLRDAAQALQLLTIMKRHNVQVTKVSYFHVLNALLHDERFTDFEVVLHICEEMVIKLPGEIVPLSLLPLIMMTAAACGESERAMKLYSHPPDSPISSFTEFRFEICLQQLVHLREYAMLMEIYRNLMLSTQASRDFKTRVSKYLFRTSVELATGENRDENLALACKILEIMNQHKIYANHRAIYPLLYALLMKPSDYWSDDDHETINRSRFAVRCAKDLQDFFSTYPHSLEWNTFTLCESIVAGVRADRVDVVDELFVHALDSGMPIKYAALEQMVVYFYRLGLVNDIERVSSMVRALRLNKHIHLGIAVTEIGMAANLRLRRYEEVVMLFEDFSCLDGDQRRVLQRKFMLKTVLEAYTNLGRAEDAMTIRSLLNEMHDDVVDKSEDIEGIGLVEEKPYKNKVIDKRNYDQISEQKKWLCNS
ncbi:hypothetical protein PsorP6_001251 [Peronosclerospora sorghi]|uniref:Uncharacterized protein n=1 Tax=Peronosclerospora sorghi TaxID=230839 RepID=A0ACC0WZ34_9STRA|nr:hypothetical protein PsorP6_001251 [Peronosclerospora sorghi]